MPAGATGPIHAVPLSLLRLGFLGSFPHHKVQRVALTFIDGNALAGTQLVDGLTRQLAVSLKLAHRKVHILVTGLIGIAFSFQSLD